MDKRELLDQLHTALGAIERCYPYYQAWADAAAKREKMQKSMGEWKVVGIVGPIMFISAGIAMYFDAFRSMQKQYGFSAWGDILLVSVLFVIPGVAMFVGYRIAHARFLRLEQAEEQARAAYIGKLAAEQTGMDLYRRLMPEACYQPRYARTFIGYLESGRAETAKEAWSLFEEMLHREQMEDMAAEQLELLRQIRSRPSS